jgi:hypothetical protein
MGRFDLETEKIVGKKQYHRRVATVRRWLPDGSKVFAPTGWWEQTDNGGLVVIDGKTGEELRRIPGRQGRAQQHHEPRRHAPLLGTITTLTVFDPRQERVLQTISDVGNRACFLTP